MSMKKERPEGAVPYITRVPERQGSCGVDSAAGAFSAGADTVPGASAVMK